jgi:hypothetical protein
MAKITAKIIHDDDPMSPRDWDNLGTMVCWHPDYLLGDEQISRYDAQETYEELPDDCEVLPLFLYDHSGITMSTTSFSCGWDSGQVGYIYVDGDRIRKEYGDDSEETRKKVIKVLQSEVKVYDQYIMGDVWGFVIEQEQDDCDCLSTLIPALDSTGTI